MSNAREATEVRLDQTRGHVSILGATGPALVTFTDLGGVLHFWPWEGAKIGPKVARELSEALGTWADKAERRAPVPDGDYCRHCEAHISEPHSPECPSDTED